MDQHYSQMDQGTGTPAEPFAGEAVRTVSDLIRRGVRERASDIHLEPWPDQMRIRFRIDGCLRDVDFLPRDKIAAVVSRIKIMAEMDIAVKRLPLDGRTRAEVDGRSVDLRVSTVPTVHGEKVVIRILDKGAALVSLAGLGFSPTLLAGFAKLIRRPWGMVLMTGPTGSGKTTTLYAALSEINSPEKNTITIEDPVEYLLEGINQIRVNAKTGLTFANGLRSILRQDPDVIMVGEIRDSETALIAVRAATTGHLIFSTMHTNDAAGALPRLLDMGVEPYLAASAVTGIVAQRLVRRICPRCIQVQQLDWDSPEGRFLELAADGKTVVYMGAGCEFCGGSGYFGRLAIQELLPVTAAIRRLIMARAPAESIRQLALEQGMTSLLRDGVEKVRQGLTSVGEIFRLAHEEE